ncbi:MAG: alpha/beta hydrolase [Dehalococcoidales bacterium]
MKRGYIDTPEGQVHYREEGTGEPLLLLHKAGLSSDEFTEMLPFLGKKYRAVAMDALGYGNTEMPVPEPGFDDCVKNILHFLDAMKLKKTNIAGHLLGSSFAVEFAAVHPEKVKKLILWDGIFLDEVERKATQEEYSTEHMEFKVDGSHLMKVWNSRNPKPDSNLKLIQRSAIEYMKSSLGEASGVSHRALFSYNIGPKLPMIKCPTLLMHGSGGPLFARQAAIRNAIPGCREVTLDISGPFPFWEQPEAVAKVMLEFLQKQ